jgi:D-methionine transport system permease protein
VTPQALAGLSLPAEHEWNPDVHTPHLIEALGETLQMVAVTLVVGGTLGMVLGLVLYGTRSGGLLAHRLVYGVLNLLVNTIRPIPFIIFLTAVRPVTTAVVGTSLGTEAATFPMIVMCVMATSRIVEQSLLASDPGIVEAARAMGASRSHVLLRVLVPEALAPLVLGYAFLFVGILDMSAMAGTIGGGGLGDFALNYGYRQYDDLVTWVAVAVMIVLVQIVQQVGNLLARLFLHR